jgi:hypothetical protein
MIGASGGAKLLGLAEDFAALISGPDPLAHVKPF